MSKGNTPAKGRRASATTSDKADRPRSGALAAMRKSKQMSKGGTAFADTSRREFMKLVGIGGASVGMSGLAAGGSAAQSDLGDAVDPRGREAPAATVETRNLFFNLSHLRTPASDHHFVIVGRKYRLTRTQDDPQVLATERRTNAFLKAVPDDQITHHAVGVEIPGDIVSMAYVSANENAATGTWEMAGMCANIPVAAMRFAYQQARMRKPRGTLPLSIKRRKYNTGPARSLRDLQEETALIDIVTFASTLVNLHPDILSVEPISAAHVQANYIGQDSTTENLSDLLSTMGTALPEGQTPPPGLTPWATLRPVIKDSTKQPYKKTDGLNAYFPDWDPQVDMAVAPAVVNIHPLVKDDPVLGVDVTGFNLNDPNDHPTPDKTTGRLWARHDGSPTVDQSPLGVADETVNLVFKNTTTEAGLVVTNPTFRVLGDGRVQITLDNVSNWFLRWLGLWVQFLDANGAVIPLKGLPHDTYPAEPSGADGYPRSQDLPDAMFLGAVGQPLTILGIPIQPGAFSPAVNIPSNASGIRILYTGLGLSGSLTPLLSPINPAALSNLKLYEAGMLLTGSFNYALVGFFMGIGASDYSLVTKTLVSIGGGAAASALSSVVGSLTNQTGFIKALGSFTVAFLKVLLQTGLGKTITAISEAIIGELVEAEVMDAIPVAGQVARAVAAVVGAVQLAETSIEVALSPPAYIFDCVKKHTLTVTFIAGSPGVFPPLGPQETMYRKVSYLFDNGTAHRLDDVTVDVSKPSITITFVDIPQGGQVNISIGLYIKKTGTPPGQNDWCAGYATTGLVSNVEDSVTPPPGLTGFPITLKKIPIDANTQYIHSQKTKLVDALTHVWEADPDGTHGPRYIPPANLPSPSLGGFDGITVRQKTDTQEGYVGYSWTAFSTGVSGCAAPGQGQFDQMANLNTDTSNGGVNAQKGYVNSLSLCGFQKGVNMGYHLLTAKSRNIYLDTQTNLVRQVNLDPPGFASPNDKQAYGLLNLDSVRCLLHPAGHIVSISSMWSKIETFKLSDQPMTEAAAMASFQARTYAGMGSRPGLMNTPVAAAIAPDGAILVLEHVNNRIQAFDIGGNPVQHFGKQASPYFLELTETQDNTYLDLAVEFTGYLYVLSLDSNNQHRLDIYHPGQTGTKPICTTHNLNAAKIAVDFWRSLYSMNYEVLTVPPSGRIPDFTEPSVSMWTPSLPKTDKSRGGR